MIKDGSLGPTVQSVMGELKPDAVYFTSMEGAGRVRIPRRGGASGMAPTAERLFLALGATLGIQPAPMPGEFASRAPDLEQVIQGYG